MQGICVSDMMNISNGLIANRTTLSRYQENGLIILPARTEYYMSGERILYHPIAAIELIVAGMINATRMFKYDDIHYGHIAAYYSGLRTCGRYTKAAKNEFRNTFLNINKRYPLEQYFIRHFYTSARTKITAINMEGMYNTYQDKLIVENSGDKTLVDTYLNYISQLYKHTFLKVYKEKWNDIEPLIRTVTNPEDIKYNDKNKPWLNSAK